MAYIDYRTKLNELTIASGMTKNDVWHLDRNLGRYGIFSYDFLDSVQFQITHQKEFSSKIDPHHLGLDHFRLCDEKALDVFTDPTDVFQANKLKNIITDKGGWYRDSTPEHIQSQILKAHTPVTPSKLSKRTREKRKMDQIVAENSEMFLLPLKDILKLEKFKEKEEEYNNQCYLYALKDCFNLVGEVALSTESQMLKKYGKECNSGSTYILNGVDHELQIFGFRMNLQGWANSSIYVEDDDAVRLQKQLVLEDEEKGTRLAFDKKTNSLKKKFNLQ